MPLQSSNNTSSSDGTSSSTSVPVNANDGASSITTVPVDKEVNSSEVNAPTSLRSIDEDDSVSLIGYSYCGQGEDYDDMICCDNKDCVTGNIIVPTATSKGVPRDQNQRRHHNFINNLIYTYS